MEPITIVDPLDTINPACLGVATELAGIVYRCKQEIEGMCLILLKPGYAFPSKARPSPPGAAMDAAGPSLCATLPPQTSKRDPAGSCGARTPGPGSWMSPISCRLAAGPECPSPLGCVDPSHGELRVLPPMTEQHQHK